MSHLLAIGCTGMLSGALRTLAPGFERVTVVARRASAFELAGSVRVDADWEDADRFVRALRDTIATQGAPDLCLAWVHDAGRAPFERVARAFGANTRLVQVLGSASEPVHDPGVGRLACERVTVRLGRMGTRGDWRWLTDDEICTGALEAVRTGRAQVVGVLER